MVRILFLLLFLPLPAMAAVECSDARSTADVVSCESDKNKASQDVLNAAFGAAEEDKSGEELKALKETQAQWVSYRDQACSLEADSIEDGSLKRVQELKCLNRLTDERIQALQQVNQDTAEKPTEVGAQPRWMNALANDYPDVFWKFGEVLQGDVDCDGADEFFMSGLKPQPQGDAWQAVIGVAENPKTGRPQTQAIAVDILDARSKNAHSKDTHYVCGSSVTLSVDLPVLEIGADRPVQTPDVCQAVLNIQDGVCAPLQVQYKPGSGRYGFVASHGQTAEAQP